MSKPTEAQTARDGLVSTRYQDYVIRDGRFVGQFDSMYRNAAEVPWHQDETVNAIFSDLTVTLLKRKCVNSLLDVGCGLGYMAERLRCEIPELKRVVGLDVSETAIVRARKMFPRIEFLAGTLENLGGDERFQVVVSKDVLWYVLDNLSDYFAALVRRSSRWVYVGQSFPESRPFYGDTIFPDAQALLLFLDRSGGGQVVYSLVERDATYSGREYVHALIEIPPNSGLSVG